VPLESISPVLSEKRIVVDDYNDKDIIGDKAFWDYDLREYMLEKHNSSIITPIKKPADRELEEQEISFSRVESCSVLCLIFFFYETVQQM